MKLFDEFVNLDGKDGHLELPLLNPEERLPTDPTISAAANETVVNNATTPIDSDWTSLIYPAVWTAIIQAASTPAQPIATSMPWMLPDTIGSAVENPKDVMDWSVAFPAAAAPSEPLNPMDWSALMADIVFPSANSAAPIADADVSPLAPVSAVSTQLGTPSATPALLLDVFESTSPEYAALSPLFPASTTASPVFKTSPTFEPEYTTPTLEPEDAIAAATDLDQFLGVPSATTTTSSSEFAELAGFFRNVEAQNQQVTEEPTVAIPTRLLHSLIQRVRSCTCCPSVTSTSSPSSSFVPPAPVVPPPTMAYTTTNDPVDPFAPRRRRVPNKLYLCSHTGCNKTFTRRFNLQTHEETHNPHRPREHACDICGKKFTRSHDLTRHAAVHDDEKHECVGCGKGYSRSDALRRHMVKCDRLGAMETEDHPNATGLSGIQKKMMPTLVKLR